MAGACRPEELRTKPLQSGMVLFLDAYEALDDELQEKNRALMTQKYAADGDLVDHMTWYFEYWVRHAWYPEWRLRLVRRGQGEWVGQDPHDCRQAWRGLLIAGTSAICGFLKYAFGMEHQRVMSVFADDQR